MNRHQPHVSVIIPAYNGASTIVRAIESVFNQSFQDFEIIVIDDGSTDDTQKVLEPYIQDRKIVYEFQKNEGCGVARNRGISRARGAFCAFLDADDYWHKEKLSMQMKAFEDDPGIIVCSTESYLVDPYSDLIYETKRDVPHRLRSGNVTRFFAFHNIITLSSTVVKKEMLMKVGGFTDRYDLMMVADLDLWLKLAPLGKFYAIQTPLMFYQTRPGITQAQIRENHRQVREVFKTRLADAPGMARFWYAIGWLRSSFLYYLQSMNVIHTIKKIGVKGVMQELLRRAYLRVDFLVYPYLLFKLRNTSFSTSAEVRDFAYRNSLRLLIPGQVESEIMEFMELAKTQKPKNILEIGTAHGGNLFLLTKLAEDGGKIISIDLPDGDYGGGYFARKKILYKSFATGEQRMILLRGDSHSQKMLSDTQAVLNGEKIDLLFIDADHSYEGVKADFEMYSSLVRKGGMIAFHDIANDPDATYGVHKYWNEIKNNYTHRELIDDSTRVGYGIGVIYFT